MKSQMEADELLELISPRERPVRIDGKGWMVSGTLYSKLTAAPHGGQTALLQVDPAQLALVAIGLSPQQKRDPVTVRGLLPRALELIAHASALIESTDSSLAHELAPARPDRLHGIDEACKDIGFQPPTLRRFIRRLRPAWMPPSGEKPSLKWAAENFVPQEWLDFEFRGKPYPKHRWIPQELFDEIQRAFAESKAARARAGHRAKEKAKERDERKYAGVVASPLPS